MTDLTPPTRKTPSEFALVANPAGTVWPHGAGDAIGQTGEFLVWAALIAQSGGRLHVFLPLLDRGIDGLVHRLDDGAYLAVQVKAKSAVSNSEAPIALYENHLFTPDQLVVGVFLDGDRLGPYSLVVDAATIKRKAAKIDDRGRAMLIIDMPVEPASSHAWSDYLVRTEWLAERLGAAQPASLTAPVPAPPAAAISEEGRVIGFLGEQEVCRRLATLDDCCLFRPFPDSEMVEVIARRLVGGRSVGIQVKTAQLDEPHAARHVLINRASFVGADSTFVVVLAWILPEHRFHETCLVIPAADIPSIAGTSGPYYELHFRASGSAEPSRLDRYRIPLESLAEELAGRLGNQQFHA